MSARNPFEFCDEDLIQLRDELYEGSWKLFQNDLKLRLKRFPCCQARNKRIRRDIETISKFMQT